jgi:hypothetical protein
MPFQTGSIDKNGLARTEDGKLYVTSVGTAAITGGSITGVSGVPYVLGASGVAVSGAADTNENTLATITIPANAMGASGVLRIDTLWTHTNSANNKILRVRLGGGAGTAYAAFTVTTVATTHGFTIIYNRGVANSQVGTSTAPSATSGSALITSAVDTTSATTIVITGQKASAGETLTLESYCVELLKP